MAQSPHGDVPALVRTLDVNRDSADDMVQNRILQDVDKPIGRLASMGLSVCQWQIFRRLYDGL